MECGCGGKTWDRSNTFKNLSDALHGNRHVLRYSRCARCGKQGQDSYRYLVDNELIAVGLMAQTRFLETFERWKDVDSKTPEWRKRLKDREHKGPSST